jgi:hypothetical protein
MLVLHPSIVHQLAIGLLCESNADCNIEGVPREGATVGEDIEGAAEGTKLGAALGVFVGTKVGADVVGLYVGAFVGTTDGHGVPGNNKTVTQYETIMHMEPVGSKVGNCVGN